MNIIVCIGICRNKIDVYFLFNDKTRSAYLSHVTKSALDIESMFISDSKETTFPMFAFYRAKNLFSFLVPQ